MFLANPDKYQVLTTNPRKVDKENSGGTLKIAKLNETYLEVDVGLRFYRSVCRNEEVT